MARGHLRQRSTKNRDSWTLYLYRGEDPVSGKKRYKTQVVHGTKRDAEKRLTDLLRQMDLGEYVEPSKETTATFFNRWFKDYAETHVRPRSLEGYRGNLDRHIIPALGNISLHKLTALNIQSVESDCQRRGLSAQTVLHCHRVTFQALRWGVRMGILARNVAEAVEPPKPQRFQARTLDWDGVQALLEAAKASKYYSLLLVALLTGLRRSEILGLEWRDLDMETGVLSVNRSLVQLHTGELSVGTPKNGRSRAVNLPTVALDCFRRILDDRKSERPVDPEDLVFSHLDGSAWRPDTVTRAFGRLVNKIGLKGIRFHDLRHTHASLLLREGVHLKVVSERLGHSGIGITGDLYSHVLPGLQEGAAVKLNEKFEAIEGVGFTKDLQHGVDR